MHDNSPSSRSNVRLTTEVWQRQKKSDERRQTHESIWLKFVRGGRRDVWLGLSVVMWNSAQTWREKRKHISLRRHWRVVPIISKMRMNYSCIIEIKSKHFQFFASIFIIFHLSPNDDFLFLFEFLRQINFHYFSSPPPRLSSAIRARKGRDANVIWISSLILISIYATWRSRWPGREQERTLSSIDFAINLCHGANKAAPVGPTMALLNDVISCSKWRCRCWQSRWQSTADNAKP